MATATADLEIAVPETRKRVIILCTGNTARSQMAEGWWRVLAGDRWEVVSAGTDPKGFIQPLAIQVMAEKGVDLSGQHSKPPAAFQSQIFDLVVTVCSNAERECPLFPNARKHEHWPFDDPAAITGTDQERLAVYRRVRDEIEDRVRSYLQLKPCPIE